MASATGAVVTVGTHPRWHRRFVLRFDDMAIALAVSAEIGQPYAPDRPEVLAPDPIVSVVCAVHYGLTFEDADGFLRGWIEPTDGDPSIWDLHLMPGEKYPAGHDPAATGGPADGKTPRRRHRGAARASAQI